ncbi:MAG: EamA family transporter RarD [Micrococcales bacterium]|nr:EamA family transporter RarD [Micrococcales bacterium]
MSHESAPETAPRAATGPGLGFAVAAYLLWGLLPLYFGLLAPAGAFEIVAWRIVFSLALCLVLLTVSRSWTRFRALVRDRRALVTLAAAGALIYINWQVYVLAAVTGHVVEASLGYFLNPLVSVVLGVAVLRERLRPAQWGAVGLSVVAAVVLTAAYGGFPWIAFALAISFGLYGFLKKRVGGRVDALGGLTAETAGLTPVAIIQLLVVGATGGVSIGAAGPVHALLLGAVGVVTAVPLLLFAAAARRLPLVLIGLTQYLTPIMQLLIGVLLLQEPMTAARWTGIGLIWAGLVVLTVDSLHAARSARRLVADPV